MQHDVLYLFTATKRYEWLLEHKLPAPLPNSLVECPTCGMLTDRDPNHVHECWNCGEAWLDEATWGDVLAWKCKEGAA